MPKFGGAPKCPRCSGSVYHAEEKIGAGASWHKMCFNCNLCHKMLDSSTLGEHDGEIYCKSCYGKKYGPKGYGFGGGAGTLSMDQGERLGNKPTQQTGPATAQAYTHCDVASDAPSKFGGADRCPRCGHSVYQAEKMIGANSSWHKKCFSCAACNKGLDSTTVCDRDGEIFCKACYAKGFGPTGVGYGQGAGTLSTGQ
ncbi:cysteine and glycine-rich protein 2 [Saccoglossus kowalevskii]|uniref:Cysteine and glycine-rich protein 2 n=1 Tax=Saccoglossus kowalevskii TaxID=10224 RepID=B5M230_SACKO|nr:cysteine and glycine-rich protein 2 [Saccoglossus kowalevskii]ACH68442.1 muscle lim protein [Saccoglossus kowalevskii]